MNHKKPSVAFVVQRCGLEVNGGAEAMCLAIARALSSEWKIEILTTKAVDYMTWEDCYREDLEEIDGVLIRRFSVDYPRNVEAFNKDCDKLLSDPRSSSLADAEAWMLAQGPISSALSEWIATHSEKYTAFFFFTYLYATTYQNMPLVAQKSVLIPNAHDEAPINLPIFKKMFHVPRFWLCNTETELNFLKNLIPSYQGQTEVVALGMETQFEVDADRFRCQTGINQKFVLYVGRIDPSKGCHELFSYWEKYKEKHQSDVILVLAGKSQIAIPTRSDIVSLGFVDEQTKRDAISACECLINPSPYESLSMVLLEAWMQEKHTLVNGACSVLREQTTKSGGGLWYTSYEEFERGLEFILAHEWCFSGREFVEKNYSWDVVREKYHDVLKKMASSTTNLYTPNVAISKKSLYDHSIV